MFGSPNSVSHPTPQGFAALGRFLLQTRLFAELPLWITGAVLNRSNFHFRASKTLRPRVLFLGLSCRVISLLNAGLRICRRAFGYSRRGGTFLRHVPSPRHRCLAGRAGQGVCRCDAAGRSGKPHSSQRPSMCTFRINGLRIHRVTGRLHLPVFAPFGRGCTSMCTFIIKDLRIACSRDAPSSLN